jgi:hypothetical protein
MLNGEYEEVNGNLNVLLVRKTLQDKSGIRKQEKKLKYKKQEKMGQMQED